MVPQCVLLPRVAALVVISSVCFLRMAVKSVSPYLRELLWRWINLPASGCLSSSSSSSFSSCGIKRQRRFHTGLFRSSSWSGSFLGSNKEDESASCTVEKVLSTRALHNPGIHTTERGSLETKGKLLREFSSTPVLEFEKKCWSCDSKDDASPFFVCTACGAIQPLDEGLDFFQLLSIERSFEVDEKELEKQYKRLQKFLHPDLSSLKSQREQGYSADQSGQVIKAYYTLLDPLSRARYLLTLNGVSIDEEGTIHDPPLLLEIMELREEIEETADPTKLQEIKEKNSIKLQDCEKALSTAFGNGDLAGAIPLVRKMTYYDKISEEITRKL
ncbi:unnamed protein product [Sphagnum jensenii]|uniref:J domain-containing protein n=1 Tax=Sphagnum jensenii TaxID=128206 RepID=A0ABP0W8N4_9BRYO